MPGLLRTVGICAVLGLTGLASGCAAVVTGIEHRKLEVNSKMSTSIFLPPINNANKTAYIHVTNTSTEQSINIEPQLSRDLETKGFTIVDEPSKAYVMIEANVLQAGKTTQDKLNAAVTDGFGGAVAGAALGGAASNTVGGSVAGGVIVGLATAATDALVQNVTYSVTTDVQISIRMQQTATQTTHTNIMQGSSSSVSQSTSLPSDWQPYTTRIVSYANQVNLKFENAGPLLTSQIASSIANLF